MAIKDSAKVTVTFQRTTVEKLRSEKGGMAWDAFMLDLVESRKQGVRARCVTCREVIESTDVDLTPSSLANRHGWREVSIRGRPGTIGFLCDRCSLEIVPGAEIRSISFPEIKK